MDKPWRWDGWNFGGGSFWNTRGDNLGARALTDGNDDVIHVGWSGEIVVRSAADARLLAAAPDLLNALRIAIADSCGGCGRETCAPCQTLASVEVGS